jgi:hypothetical protein
MRIRSFAGIAVAAVIAGCAVFRASRDVPKPRIIPHSEWEESPPLGYAADATRRNKRAGDSLTFRDLKVNVIGVAVDSTGAKPVDVVNLQMVLGDTKEERTAREGSAFNWNGFHVAVVAIYGQGELGAGLVALEVATLESVPPVVRNSEIAGGADMRLRIPHKITHVTLHHTGDSRPLLHADSAVFRLRGIQRWGASDRNWWDLPYHFLLGLNGEIFEGRDYRYMGETNTAYNPEGHFLISIIGNYGRQEPTPALMNSIADLMAWAVDEFDVPLDRIGGHYNYAETTCPGTHLRKYLEDGTFRRMVAERLARR